MRPIERTGNSANITFYRERDVQPGEPYVWCEVLRNVITRRDGEYVQLTRPRYAFRVVRSDQGVVAEFDHIGTPNQWDLPARTVARLLRQKLEKDNV